MPGTFIPSLPIFLSGIRIQPLEIMENSKKIPTSMGLEEKPYYKKPRKMPFESTYSQTALSRELKANKKSPPQAAGYSTDQSSTVLIR